MKQPEIKNRKGFGIQRDRMILNFVLKHKYVTASQVAKIFFPKVESKWRLRKAIERLELLVKRRYIKSFIWYDGEIVYSYKPEKKGQKINHALTVTEVATVMLSRLSNWESLEYEIECEEQDIVADMKIDYWNKVKEFGFQYWIEIQLDSHEPISEKVNKYIPLLLRNKESILVLIYKRKRTAEDLLEMRLPSEIKKKIWCLPLERVRKEGIVWGGLRSG